MKTKISLVLTLVITALLVISTFGAVLISADPEEESLEVVKEVWDEDAQEWVDEIDADLYQEVAFRITITYHNVTQPQYAHYAENIVVNDTLPDCLEYVTGSAEPFEPDISGDLLTWDLGTTKLYDDESYVITFNATAEEYGENINEVEAEADERCTGLTIYGSDTATVNVIEPNIEIDVEKKVWDYNSWDEETQVYSGETVSFRLIVENTGESTLTDLYVNDTLPDGFAYETGSATVDGVPTEPTQNGNVLTWSFPGDFEPEDEIIILFDATAYGDPCSYHTNWVDVIADGPCGSGSAEDSDSANVRINGMCLEKLVQDLDTGEWVDEIYAGIGDTVRFKITLCYYGGYILYNIKVTDVLPECLEYADNAVPEEPEISEDGMILWWNLSSDYNLENGECVTIEFDAMAVCSECEVLVNFVEVIADECSGDTFYEEDTATVHVECPLTVDAGGPYSGDIDEEIELEAAASGGNPPYDYYWDLDEDGVYEEEGKVVTNSWDEEGVYTVWVKVIDDEGTEKTDYATVTVGVINNPPRTPTISGPNTGVPGVEYDFTVATVDPEGDQVYYYVDWGDGTNSGWLGPYDSGDPQIVSYTWALMGNFVIKVKAKDTHGDESGWEILSITMPRNRQVNRPIFNFLEKYQDFFPILKLLLQRLGL